MRKIVITKFNRNCCFLSYLKDVLDWFFILQILSKIQKKKKKSFLQHGSSNESGIKRPPYCHIWHTEASFGNFVEAQTGEIFDLMSSPGKNDVTYESIERVVVG